MYTGDGSLSGSGMWSHGTDFFSPAQQAAGQEHTVYSKVNGQYSIKVVFRRPLRVPEGLHFNQCTIMRAGSQKATRQSILLFGL